MIHSLLITQNLQFKCSGCGKCCTLENGVVYGTRKDFKLIAAHLKMSLPAVLKKYTDSMDGLASIKADKKGTCIFYKDNKCAIYPVRPTQCRTFPFWRSVLKSKKTWNKYAKDCPGMNQGREWTQEEVIEQLDEFVWSLFQLQEGEEKKSG